MYFRAFMSISKGVRGLFYQKEQSYYGIPRFSLRTNSPITILHIHIIFFRSGHFYLSKETILPIPINQIVLLPPTLSIPRSLQIEKNTNSLSWKKFSFILVSSTIFSNSSFFSSKLSGKK